MTNQLGTNVSYLKINEETFKKTAKRLTSLFRDSPEYSNKIPLNVMQDNLAKSLGFRNTDSIINYFKKKEESLPATKNDNRFILNWTQNNPGNPEFLVNLILSLVDDNGSDTLWRKNAIPLLSAVMGALIYMSDEEEILIDSNTISEHLTLDTIITMYKTRRDFPNHIRHALRLYLINIPGFQEGATKQNDSVLNHHGFLQMQFHHALHVLKKLEKCDPIILNPNWFQAEFYKRPSVGECPIIFTSFMERINSTTLDNIYNMYDIEALKNLYKEDKSLLPPREWINYHTKDNVCICFKGIQLITSISNSVYAQDSWLYDPSFIKILIGMISNKQMKPLYLTDLLMYSFKIVNQTKRTLYLNCVHNLLKNYETVVEYSKEIHELAN